MTFKEIQKILKDDGRYYYDTVGSHMQYKHPIKPRKSNFAKTWRRCEKRHIEFNIKTGRVKIEWRKIMKLVYPAIFNLEEDGTYSVEVPDLKGCITQGETLDEAIQMAEDAALGWLLTAVEDMEDLPKPSNINNIKLESENSFTSLLLLDLTTYSQKYGERKSIKKTLSIPVWLNERAEKCGVNFSKILQDALFEKIFIKSK